MIAVFPEERREFMKYLLGIRIPRPPEIIGEFTQIQYQLINLLV
jgi:hypothetical protein